MGESHWGRSVTKHPSDIMKIKSLDTELKQGSNLSEKFESRQAWIVDVLQPEYVVKEIVHAIQTNANMVLLPKILNVVFVLQAILPRKASYLLGKWAGIHDCMNNVSFGII